MAHLPNEIYALIFSLVEPGALGALSITCKNFNSLLRGNKWLKFLGQTGGGGCGIVEKKFIPKFLRFADCEIGKYILRGEKFPIRALIPCVSTKSLELVKYVLEKSPEFVLFHNGADILRGVFGNYKQGTQYEDVFDEFGNVVADKRPAHLIVNESMRQATILGCVDIVKFFMNSINMDIGYTKEEFYPNDNHRANDEDYKSSLVRLSVRNRHLELAKYFVEQGADINKNEISLIYDCIENNDVNMFKYISSLDTEDDLYEEGLLYDAIGYGHLEMAEHIISYMKRPGGPGVNQKTKTSSMCVAASNKRMNFIKYFDSVWEGISYEKAFITTAKYGYLDIVQYFISRGGDDLVAGSGSSAMFVAIQNDNFDIVKFLWVAGAKPTEEGIELAREQNADIFKYLVDRGGQGVGRY